MTIMIEHDGPHAPGDPGEAAALEAVRSLLVEGETIFAYAMQHRLFALTHRRSVAAATSGRFLYVTRRLLGGYDPVGVRVQDIKEASLAVGLFSATLTLSYSSNMSDTAVGEGQTRVLVVSGLIKEAAAALYRVCQGQEQAWREKRRVRSIEEMRAQSGGVQIATGVYPQGGATERTVSGALGAGAQSDSPSQRLQRAKELLDQHLITDAEYEEIKAKIVAGL